MSDLFDDLDQEVADGEQADAEAYIRSALDVVLNGQADAAVVVGAGRARRARRAARGGARPDPRGDPPGAVAAEGARGVPGRDPAQGRRHHGRGPGADRADGPAHRGRPPGEPRRPADPRRRQRGGPPPPPRGGGLRRPEAGQLRDRARPHHEDGPGRPGEAPGQPHPRRRDRRPGRHDAGRRRRMRRRPTRTRRASSTRTSPEVRSCPDTDHRTETAADGPSAGSDGRSGSRWPPCASRTGPPGTSTAQGRSPSWAPSRWWCPRASRWCSTSRLPPIRAGSCATGTVVGPVAGECRRCGGPVGGTVVAEVRSAMPRRGAPSGTRRPTR